MSAIQNSETTAEYPRHIMLTVAYTQLKEQGLDDIAELLQQMNRAHHTQAKRMARLEGALGGLADFCEQAGFDCQRARALLANEAPAKEAEAPVVTDAQYIAMLQEALAFWLPMVQGNDEMAGRIANDAWLLCGMAHVDVDKLSAEALGWITVNAAPSDRAMPIPGDILRLKRSDTINGIPLNRGDAWLVNDEYLRVKTVPAPTAPSEQSAIGKEHPAKHAKERRRTAADQEAQRKWEAGE